MHETLQPKRGEPVATFRQAGQPAPPAANMLDGAPHVRRLEAQGELLNSRTASANVAQAVRRTGNVAIGTVRMGSSFLNRHVASTEGEAADCADYRLDVDRQVISSNTTASIADWRAGVNANTSTLAEGSHEIAATVNCRETTVGRNMHGGRTFTHSNLAATAKTLGVNVQNHDSFGWRLFINHVHGA
jgi:hypothetical protein